MKSLLTLIILMSTSFARAEKMDLETHTAVINRLSVIIQNLDDSDPSKVPSSLRMADLLAERSRLKGLKQVEMNCDNCLKATEDRRMAEYYYSYVIPKLDDATRSQAMLQKAHMHFTLGEMAQTEKMYTQIIVEGRKRHSNAILGETYASLGDVLFQKAEFKKSQGMYQKALAIKETPQRGMVYYRLAWCLFNQDQVGKAVAMMEMVLSTPSLTEMKTTSGFVQDPSFKIDVSKDLASFYARTTITRERINRLMTLSPVEKRQENLYSLATEADRLGKKREAALAWMIYIESDPNGKNTLEAQIRLMRIKRDLNDPQGALQIFAHVGRLFQDPGCGDKDKCASLQSQIRQWIVNWNKEEKTVQTASLTQAYVMYTQIFPEDAEMYLWGADVAKQRKQYPQAFDLYNRSAEVAYKKLGKGNESQKKETAKIFEASLMGEIDMAETMKSYNHRIAAYNHYLKLNSNGSEEYKVRYQIAQTEFEKPDYEKAAGLFRKLALEKAKDRQLQRSAADMSIECLTRLKRQELIEPWAYEYAKVFPEAQQKYFLVHRKTVLNLVAGRINTRSADANDLKRLDSISLLGATPEDRISLNKSRYLLAVRLQNFDEAKKANLNLIDIKELSTADRKEAIQSRIWIAELELDFRTAYYLTEAQSGKADAERSLKLIWLAHMAGLNPEKHENDFLRQSRNRALRATVIARRIQRSRAPDRELKKFSAELSESPETLARLALEIYGRTHHQDVLKTAFQYKGVRRSPTGAVIGRMLEYPDLNQEIRRLTSSRLNSRTDKALKKSLEERLKLMAAVEKSGQRAISNHDIVLQAVILTTLAQENGRLHQDILNLPLPKGLTQEQMIQYQRALAQQAEPFRIKAAQVDQKRNQLWADKSWTDQLAKNYVEARNEYKPALRQDIEKLMVYAPDSVRSDLESALERAKGVPGDKEIAQARHRVRANPFDQEYVLELKDLENRRGNDIAVAHLDARLSQMKGVVR